MDDRESVLADLADRLEPDTSVSVLTGAGISAASGIPTFRGDDGLWEDHDPSDLASPEGFRRDPETVWRWYDERRRMIDEADPNPGHEALANWEKIFERFSLVTQNVDGLHEEAGSDRTIKLHGNIWSVSCWDDCSDSPRRWTNRDVPLPEVPPRCDSCGGLLRPEVVWFGEQLDPAVLEDAQRAVHCDVFFTIGTSAEVHPAAGFIRRAADQGAYTVEVNPDSTAASGIVDLSVPAGAETFLPELTGRLAS